MSQGQSWGFSGILCDFSYVPFLLDFKHLGVEVLLLNARNHFSPNFCHCFGCGSHAVWMWFGRGLDVVRMWGGGGSDVFPDLAQTVWQKLRESGFQHS